MAFVDKFFYALRINIIKSLYYNLKLFKFKEAIKFPILIGYNTTIKSIGNIQTNVPVHTGLLKLGVMRNLWESNREPIIFYNRGLIIVDGLIKIHPGAKIIVLDNAVLRFGGDNTIGARTILVCAKSINIGNNSGCSWDCNIFDTDFHFLYNVETNEPFKRIVPIKIGDNVFIGNHCNISKGTKLPNGAVVSSWSKVTGSFIKRGDYIVLAGNPASVISQGYTMTHAWEYEKEKEFMRLFEE